MTDEQKGLVALLEQYTVLSPEEKQNKSLLLKAKYAVEKNLGIKLGEKDV